MVRLSHVFSKEDHSGMRTTKALSTLTSGTDSLISSCMPALHLPRLEELAAIVPTLHYDMPSPLDTQRIDQLGA